MAATTFQSDDSGSDVSQSVSPPWSSIVKGPAADAVSSAPVSVVRSPTFSSSVEEQTGNLTSDSCVPSPVPEIVPSPDDSAASDSGGGGGSNVSKKTVWNKPSNGVVEVVSPVMGAVSWPALGDFSKSSPKSSSSESLKGLADGPSPSALQSVTENSSSSVQKQTTANNATPASTQNHVAPAKLRSTKRGGGGINLNVSANGGVSHVSATSQDSVESSPRDNPRVESIKGGFGSQSQNGNDRQHQRNTYRRSNSGPHSRGDGSYNHGYGGKRDQDREWNQHSKSFNGRDSHVNSQRGYPRGYVRPTVHTPPPFMPPQMPLLRPFGNNMMYPDMSSPVFYVQGGPPPPPEALRGMPPLVGPIPPPMYFVSNPMLHSMIVNQIDFYFSNDNLVKDIYLRKNMDEQGWVPVSLIAGFKKVLNLTDNIQLILDALRASTIVEVQGDKIRRRNDWMRWLLQPPAQAVGNQDALASQLQGVTLDDVTPTIQDSVLTSFGSGGSSGQSQLGGGDVDDQRLII